MTDKITAVTSYHLAATNVVIFQFFPAQSCRTMALRTGLVALYLSYGLRRISGNNSANPARLAPAIPRSVTIPVTSRAGVTSKA